MSKNISPERMALSQTNLSPQTKLPSQSIVPPIPPSLLDDSNINKSFIKQQLTYLTIWLKSIFESGVTVETILQSRAEYIDQLLLRFWQFFQLEIISNQSANNLSLIACGGYGRQELHPLSDIDILFLSKEKMTSQQEDAISHMITFLWDLKLEIGQSVRTLPECLHASHEDLTIYTSLLEARLICGNAELFNALVAQTSKDNFWTSEHFFTAKRDEQFIRHQHYHGTNYNLEPDIKASPGGLRDIHILQWIARRHFGAITINEMVAHNFINKTEQLELKECQNFLWRIRFALHLVISRYDNRLLFDRQLEIAKLLGYQGEGNSPIEAMMGDYYRVTCQVRELNQMLIQLFYDSVLKTNKNAAINILDDDFQIIGSQISLRNNALFMHQPACIIKMFYYMTYHENITGIYSETLRYLRNARHYLTLPIAEDSKAREYFLAILKHPKCVSRALLPMHHHGVLTAYLYQWNQIVGLMQFDLFHVYTVDEHTIQVLLNIEQFSDKTAVARHPLCVEVYPALPQKELLLIAALFHDIAKGQGGNHSILGAEDVEAFAVQHGFEPNEIQIISWLVRDHLLMSTTAQRKDLQDPLVIQQFSSEVRDETRLQYLLCLTVADICATNETLWNNWKQSLIKQLYCSTQKQLNHGIQSLPDMRSSIRQHRKEAKQMLLKNNIDENELERFWSRCRADYFLRHSPEQLVWHATHLLQQDYHQPLVLISPQTAHGGTEIFVYSPDRPYLFASVAGVLDKRNLNVHAAQIFTNRDDMAMDTFIVLEPDGRFLAKDRHTEIQRDLELAITKKKYQPPKARRTSSKLSHFMVPTQIKFTPFPNGQRTYMELITLDRPGLLARVGEVFAELQLSLHAARVITIGERVEDLFILTDANNLPLSIQLCDDLRYRLINILTTTNEM